jgi:quercetin dioxygenase-like cupin family protein
MRKLCVAGFVLAIAGFAGAQAPAPSANQIVSKNAAPPVSLANVDLADDFPQLKGYRFTQNLYTIAPGTGRAMHSHAGAPEIVHIISGTLTDARQGGKPTAYGPGSTLLNVKGTNHMWANLGTEPVVFLATSIKSPNSAQGGRQQN